MFDPLLETRIRELTRILERMVLPWPEHTGFLDLKAPDEFRLSLSQGLLPADLRDSLEGLLRDDARDLYFKLNSRLERLADLKEDDPECSDKLTALWEDYRVAERRCGQLFQEFLELLGGLAFRDRTSDTWFFDTADHLMGVWANQVQDHGYLTVTLPWMQDTIRSSLAQLVRLRFPDWTVWALPLAAFGFGHTYMTGGRRKSETIRGRISEELDIDPETGLDEDMGILMGDVFATGVMGPSYALAALRLRLTPSDTWRTHVILRTLELLGSEHHDLAASLRKEWDACVAAAPVTDDEQADLRTRVEAVYGAYTVYLRAPARYPGHKWNDAMELVKDWEEQRELDERATLYVKPMIRDRIGVPEVLNAAWYARWKGGTWDARELAMVARETCQDILHPAADEDAGAYGGLTGSAATTSGARGQQHGRPDGRHDRRRS